jgi:hypothetical protein
LTSDKKFTPSAKESIGFVRLIEQLALPVPLPTVRSQSIAGARRTTITETMVVEQYPRSYAPDNLIGHLKFAMRYEPIDLGVAAAAFEALDRRLITKWIRAEHSGVFARRAWYLYELLTGKTLDVPDVSPTGYIDLLDRERHIAGPAVRVPRQRINANLLGSKLYCPLIRRTEAMETAMAAGLDREARELAESCGPSILARAVNYLYTKETKSSFAIEGEVAGADRSERFVAALAEAASFQASDPRAYVALQNAIVDSRYAEGGWRKVQNFVGQTRSDFSEQVHYVCPRPEDVKPLMENWMRMVEQLHASGIDAVCAAAAAAFGFVFVHPFEDGNGRIHRFLIHHILARAGFTPEGLLLPVSAAMLRDRRAYDRVLNSYSAGIMPFIRFHIGPDGWLKVQNKTAHLYRYWDATAFAEYLYLCVTQAVRHDLREEIGFLQAFDRAIGMTMSIVDMPDRRASLLVRLILQNKGKLSQAKRKTFPEITREELAKIERAVALSSE